MMRRMTRNLRPDSNQRKLRMAKEVIPKEVIPKEVILKELIP